jgi:hypothetical protein
LAINTNTTVAVDGLVLTPSSNYIITGANALTRKPTLTHPSISPAIKRTFQWNTTLPIFSGAIGIYYEEAELNGLLEPELTLNNHNGSIWQAYPSGVTRNTTANVVTTLVNDLTLNELTLAAETHPLPLTWGPITAQRKREGAIIEWQTFNEIHTDLFEVESSITGTDWKKVGSSVSAMNTTGTHQYHLIDVAATSRKTLYRIKQVDLDGQWSYSTIVWIPSLQQQAAVSLYPNPATELIYIQSPFLPMQAVHLFDGSGKRIKTALIPNTTSYTLPVSWLPKSLYTLQVLHTDGTTTNRCFIKK